MSRLQELVARQCPDGVPLVPLKSVGTWFGGSTPSKGNPAFWTNGTIPWLTPKDMAGPSIKSTEDFVTDLALERSALRLIPQASVAFVMRSNILRRRLPIALVPQPVTLNQDMRAVVPSEDISVEYLAQVCRAASERMRREIVRTVGSMAAVPGPALMDFLVPMPPRIVQDEVARVLSSMESLQAELEAELEARRQQYEFYRDSLLRFESKPPPPMDRTE